jgi:hypothetical protein
MKRHHMLATAAAVITLVVPLIASAQAGRSSRNTEKGRFAIRNDAYLGISASRPFRHNARFTPSIAIGPSLDIFVIDNLAVGAAIDFNYVHYGDPVPDFITFAVSPRIGYNVALHDIISFWPQVSVGVGFVSADETDPILPITGFFPFYLHPADNFFLGIGPGVTVQPLTKRNAYLNIQILQFSIGGSFPVF